jgi:hypothetical protein
MEAVRFEDLGAERWDDFCAGSKDAWLLHTSFWLHYTLALYAGKKENKSFVVIENKQILAACPLIIEHRESHGVPVKEFTYNGEACPLPALQTGLSEKKRKKVLDFVFTAVDGLAESLSISRAAFRYNILSASYYKAPATRFNGLLRYGYLETNLYTQSISLETDSGDLFKEMRSGHRQSVNKAVDSMSFAVYDEQNISLPVFTTYQKLHEKAAGKKTRSQDTFNLMCRLIEQGNAKLCRAEIEGNTVGFALVFVYKGGALYASACNDPDHRRLPIGHGIQWNVIRDLQACGVERYDVGLQVWPQFHYIPSEKEGEISSFKRGFGGETLPVFSGEKFYDEDYMRILYAGRLQRYIDKVHL